MRKVGAGDMVGVRSEQKAANSLSIPRQFAPSKEKQTLSRPFATVADDIVATKP
jgi:hypothetical protein